MVSINDDGNYDVTDNYPDVIALTEDGTAYYADIEYEENIPPEELSDYLAATELTIYGMTNAELDAYILRHGRGTQ